MRLEGDDLIVMGDARSTSRVPRPLVDRIEIGWGRKGHPWKGLIIGAATGALVGAVGDPGTDPSGARLTRGQSIGQCAVGGAAIGALIGALVRTDQWVEVPAGGLRITAGPSPGRGGGVSMGVAF